ncbi:hypothetical protein [Streptosporangium sp. NPDC004631]
MSQWPSGASSSARPGKPIFSCRHYLASTSPCSKCSQPQQTKPAGGTR